MSPDTFHQAALCAGLDAIERATRIDPVTLGPDLDEMIRAADRIADEAGAPRPEPELASPETPGDWVQVIEEMAQRRTGMPPDVAHDLAAHIVHALIGEGVLR